jgi:4-diphosphocytidyl-2-C-methyl-D-erythritol kinase
VSLDRITTNAPAKLNLGLSILRRREDGFHDLISLFQTISLCDEISLERADTITLECSDPDLPAGPDNLAWRAADLMRETFSISDGVSIHLEKRIPAGAGLGGGSSDAAAVVRGLARLWEIDAGDDVLRDLCARLGSDIPFLFRGGTAIVEGRGEAITPLPSQETLHAVVAVPDVHVSTPWAYGQLSLPFADASEYCERIETLRAGTIGLREFCMMLGNDFQPVVERYYPEIGRLTAVLRERGAYQAIMSGSGSSVFGLFGDPQKARDAAHDLPDAVLAEVVGTISADELF